MATAPRQWGRDEEGRARLADRRQSPFEDPVSSLPQTARNLLIAAKEILADEGFEALTLQSVSERAGENKAMVSYYFDNKAGLVAAVLDSVIYDDYVASLGRMKAVAPGVRVPRLIEELGRMATSSDHLTVFFELLPHALRDEVQRRRLAMLYRWCWDMKLDWLGAEDGAAGLSEADRMGLAQFLSALADGLSIQVAVDPEVDVSNPLRMLARLLESLGGVAPEA